MLFYLLVLSIFFTSLLWSIFFSIWSWIGINQNIIDNNFINFVKYTLNKNYVKNKNNWFNVNVESNWDFSFGDSNQIKQWFYKFWRLITKTDDTTTFQYINWIKWKCFKQQVNWNWKKDLCEWNVVTNSDLKILYNNSWWWNISNWDIPIYINSEEKSSWKWILLHIYKVWWYDKLYKIELIKIEKLNNWNFNYKIISYFYY